MNTTRAQLDQWLAEPEGLRLEFKEAKQRYDFEKLLKYCVALANEGGGTIVLGVTDQRPRRIVGTQAFEDPGRTEAGLHQRLGHRIPVEELRLPEGRVLVVHVPTRLPGTAWNLDGRYFKRAGDDLAHLGDHELRTLFAEAGPDFSAQPCPGATLADLEPASLALFRERWARKSGDPRKRELSDQQTLRDAELLVDGDQVSYAALILFGTRSGLTRYWPKRSWCLNTAQRKRQGLLPTAKNTERAFSPGKTRFGKRSTCAMTDRAFRTIFFVWTCRLSTRCRCAKPS